MGWGIVGHEWAIDYLQRSIAAGRHAHAYLVSGPNGVGKALLALRLAQALNCETAGSAPCLECRTCRLIENGNHPDVRIASMETQAASASSSQAARQRDLKIGTIREWQRDISLKPYEGRRRVFILHDAERLNEEASNAMLKTLEEPPLFATIILVANTSNLLATIVSRCQSIRLRPLPRQQVAQALIEQAGVDEQQATLLAAWSGGRVGWALHMAASSDSIQTRQAQLDELLQMQNDSRTAFFRWAEERSKEYRGGEQETVLGWLELWRSWWHDMLLVAAGCTEYCMHIDRINDLQRSAQHYTLPEIYDFVVQIGDAVRHLRENVNPQLALEHVFLNMPSAQR